MRRKIKDGSVIQSDLVLGPSCAKWVSYFHFICIQAECKPPRIVWVSWCTELRMSACHISILNARNSTIVTCAQVSPINEQMCKLTIVEELTLNLLIKGYIIHDCTLTMKDATLSKCHTVSKLA
mmetsp:Transcript_14868/g.37061  ORF Transcript_14868/g.37061 Transcript_14868/m.37061 type:complete len:124 (-) Transcript_14868:545-916(-)